MSIDSLPFFRTEDISDINELSSDVRVESAFELLEALKDNQAEEDKIKTHAMLDNLIARADTKWWRFWDSKIDWKVGIALEMEGRIAEAIPFMRRMESLEMGVFGMPQEESSLFLVDMARILASRDLCHFSNYDEARLYAQNAMEISQGDVEVKKTVSDTIAFINEQATIHLKTLEAAVIGAGNRENEKHWLDFVYTRLNAEKALADGDIMAGLAEIWNLVRENHSRFPQNTLPFWDWLQTHILRFNEAGYDMSENDFKAIIDGIFHGLPSLAKSGMLISEGFMELLKTERGVKFEIESDNTLA